MDEPQSYSLEWLDKALEELGALPTKDATKIFQKMERLAANINALPHEAMKGNWTGHYRYRIGNYRAIYRLLHDQQQLVVVSVGHRRNVYDD